MSWEKEDMSRAWELRRWVNLTVKEKACKEGLFDRAGVGG